MDFRYDDSAPEGAFVEDLHQPRIDGKAGSRVRETNRRRDQKGKHLVTQDKKELLVKNTGKLDPKKHISDKVEEVLNDNIINLMGSMISSKAF